MPSARETLRRADPVLARLMEAHSAIDLWAWRARWPRDRFALLVRSIVGQQISTSAASAILAAVSASSSLPWAIAERTASSGSRRRSTKSAATATPANSTTANPV